jgi:hypothetical protein
MPKSKSKATPPSPPVDVEERKRIQYITALTTRDEAQGIIKTNERWIANNKASNAELQNLIRVLEMLLYGQLTVTSSMILCDPGKVVAEYLMDVIREANELIKANNAESDGYREKLIKFRKLFADANKTIASIIENGPDMQNVMFDDDEN